MNSGKSTRERNIEETAVKTNIEAAEEIARQLRLRDLAGLIVIDFIDMEDGRNIRRVERRLKDAMKTDRARLQIGRISNFGLLELSRQRLRPSLLETSSQICPHCRGTGNILSTESMAMRVLRAIEEEGVRMRTSEITVRVPTEVALYILNQKRATLVNLESRYGFQVILEGDDTVVPPDIDIERVKGQPEPVSGIPSRGTGAAQAADDTDAGDADDDVGVISETDGDEEKSDKPKRSRRRRGRRRSQNSEARADTESGDDADADSYGNKDGQEASGEKDDTAGEEKQGSRRRRRGRRGGRRRNRTFNAEKQDENAAAIGETGLRQREAAEGSSGDGAGSSPAEAEESTANSEAKTQAALGIVISDPKAGIPAPNGTQPNDTTDNGGTPDKDAKENIPESASGQSDAADESADITDATVADENKPKRRGWWQKIVD